MWLRNCNKVFEWVRERLQQLHRWSSVLHLTVDICQIKSNCLVCSRIAITWWKITFMKTDERNYCLLIFVSLLGFVWNSHSSVFFCFGDEYCSAQPLCTKYKNKINSRIINCMWYFRELSHQKYFIAVHFCIIFFFPNWLIFSFCIYGSVICPSPLYYFLDLLGRNKIRWVHLNLENCSFNLEWLLCFQKKFIYFPFYLFLWEPVCIWLLLPSHN